MTSLMLLPDPSSPLDHATAEAAFADMLDGRINDDAIAGFLIALADRGETSIEIAAAARAMRARMIEIAAPSGAIDVCGTGGDGSHSLNVSTAVALVVGACGIPVAKHGNRAASSKAGAADTLEALGLDLARASAMAEASLADLGIAFLFAQAHHPALARLGPIRRAIGRRTIFNLLGPLANPARVSRQLVGVARPELIGLYAEALRLLGTEAAMVVSGEEGLDELSVSGPTRIGLVADGRITETSINPEDAGLPRHPSEALRGGDPAHNAAALRRLLQGEAGAYRDAVLLASAAALLVANRVDEWRDGVRHAAQAIDSGLANALLDRWIAFCR
jgi:anthranilate phosphoribosyltransferase